MHAYICGLAKMVKANRELLKSLDWDRSLIRYERYDLPANGLQKSEVRFQK
jgi:ferredoxin-NADP reductase